MADDLTRAAFEAHVRLLEAQALAGDLDAVRSLACMALIMGDDPDADPPEEAPNVVDLIAWRAAA